MTVTTTIKSFEDACQALGLDPSTELPFPEPQTDRQKGTNAAHKIFIIAEALNEGWKPNWYDWNEYKYYPWFDLSPEKHSSSDKAAGGSGFSFGGYRCDISCSGVGSRLVFRTAELATYAGTQFLDVYKDLMVLS